MRICMFGFSGQNMNLWLKYFRDRTDHRITLFTPWFEPSRDYAFERLRVVEIDRNQRNRFIPGFVFHRWVRIRARLHFMTVGYDLVLMHGLYNWAFAPFLFLHTRASRKVILLWNDLNHRKLHRRRNCPEASGIMNAIHAADLILPTWQPTADAFAVEFPELASRTRVRSWGTETGMLSEIQDRGGAAALLAGASESDAPVLFWPRTLREGIRHDILLDALGILADRSVDISSILVMGKADDSPWSRKVLSRLRSLEGRSRIISEHTRFTPLSDLHEVYRKADLMVNLADSDQVSTCVVEAFLFGLDVVLSNIPPYRVLRDMGLHVRLVDNDPGEVAAAIQEIIAAKDSPETAEKRRMNRETAERLFDLDTNLNALIEFATAPDSVPRRTLLFLAPQSPPLGGVADQSALLLQSESLNDDFKTVPVRTNPVRSTEDPSRKERGSIIHSLGLPGKALRLSRMVRPHAVQLVANGDASFIRDMTAALAVKYIRGIPLAVHLHCSRRGFWHDRSASSGTLQGKGLPRRAAWALSRFLARRADSLSHLTEGLDEHYRKEGFPGADLIIPNCTAYRPDDFTPGIQGSILYVGRLTREKGFFDLLASLEGLNHDQWRLDVLGEFSSNGDRSLAESILREHRWKNSIFLHGPVTGEGKWSFFSKASIFVLPTRIDVFPVVIVEAMAHGCAVVTTDVGEIGEIHGSENFEFVEPGNSRALTEALQRLLDNPGSCAAKGRANYLSSEPYTVQKAASLLGGNLIRLIRGGRRG